MANFTESVVEDAALAWLESLGYAVKHGTEIDPGEFLAEWGQLLQKMQQFDFTVICKKRILLFRKRQLFPNGK